MKKLFLISLLVASPAYAQHHGPHQDVVAQVKDAVLKSGIDIKHGPGECGRFEITKRVAWTLRNEGAGLLAKFGAQNGCSATNTTSEPKFGVDVIVYPDGEVYDILVGSGDGNTPAWNYIGNGAANLYRPAFDTGTIITPPDNPPPNNGDLENRVKALEIKVDQLQKQVDGLKDRITVNEAKLNDHQNQINDLWKVFEDFKTWHGTGCVVGRDFLGISHRWCPVPGQ